MKTTIHTETDLTTGERVYSFDLSPMPINTPAGTAPGRLLVKVAKNGSLEELELLSRPTQAAFRESVKRLASQADWEMPVQELEQSQGNPVVVLKLKTLFVKQWKTPIQSPEDLNKLLSSPFVRDGKNYRVENIEIES